MSFCRFLQQLFKQRRLPHWFILIQHFTFHLSLPWRLKWEGTLARSDCGAENFERFRYFVAENFVCLAPIGFASNWYLHTLFPRHLKFGQDGTCLNQPKPSKWGTAFTTMPCAIKRSSARDGKNLLKISLMTVGFRVDWALRCAASLRALGLIGASMRSTPTSAVARGSKHLLHGFHRRLRFQKCYSPTLWNQMGRSVQDHSWRWTCLFAAGLQLMLDLWLHRLHTISSIVLAIFLALHGCFPQWAFVLSLSSIQSVSISLMW